MVKVYFFSVKPVLQGVFNSNKEEKTIGKAALKRWLVMACDWEQRNWARLIT